MGYGSVNVNIFWAPWGFFGPRRGFSMMEVEPLGTLGSVGAPGGLVYVDFLVGFGTSDGTVRVFYFGFRVFVLGLWFWVVVLACFVTSGTTGGLLKSSQDPRSCWWVFRPAQAVSQRLPNDCMKNGEFNAVTQLYNFW